MKKLYSILLALTLCFSFTACNDGSNTSLGEQSRKMESETLSAESTSSVQQFFPSSSPDSGTNTETSSKAPVSSAAKPTSVRVTIPEGFSFAQICKRMEEKGVCTAEDLMNTINTYDFSYYPLVGAVKADANRCFKLEGYLYPDTYDFKIDEKPQNVLGKMLKNAEAKITAADRSKAAAMGYSMEKIITMASLIEKETGSKSEMKTVASVFYNRLKSKTKLQCDASINYVERYIKPYITGDINRYNSYYNTYKCAGLPKGPICNPGKAAIQAALNPENTDYLFFVSDAAGKYYYATTYEEHLANCKTAGVSAS